MDEERRFDRISDGAIQQIACASYQLQEGFVSKGSRVMSRNLSITSTRVEEMRTYSEQVVLRFWDVPSAYKVKKHTADPAEANCLRFFAKHAAGFLLHQLAKQREGIGEPVRLSLTLVDQPAHMSSYRPHGVPCNGRAAF
jgi:hypothetical protein